MMTLKQFEKVNSEVVTEYTIFTGENRYIDSLTVDFLEDTDTLTPKLRKLRELESDKTATVKHVSVNSCNHHLTVTVFIS